MTKPSRYLLIAMSIAFALCVSACSPAWSTISLPSTSAIAPWKSVMSTAIPYNKALGALGILGMLFFFAFLLSLMSKNNSQ